MQAERVRQKAGAVAARVRQKALERRRTMCLEGERLRTAGGGAEQAVRRHTLQLRARVTHANPELQLVASGVDGGGAALPIYLGGEALSRAGVASTCSRTGSSSSCGGGGSPASPSSRCESPRSEVSGPAFFEARLKARCATSRQQQYASSPRLISNQESPMPSHNVALSQPPQLLVSPSPQSPNGFGGWRRLGSPEKSARPQSANMAVRRSRSAVKERRTTPLGGSPGGSMVGAGSKRPPRPNTAKALRPTAPRSPKKAASGGAGSPRRSLKHGVVANLDFCLEGDPSQLNAWDGVGSTRGSRGGVRDDKNRAAWLCGQGGV